MFLAGFATVNKKKRINETSFEYIELNPHIMV